jgi:hypothetical protein
LLDLARWLGGDIIRLDSDAIRLVRIGDDTIRLARLGDNIMRLMRLGGDIIRLSVKYWENLGCLVTMKRL